MVEESKLGGWGTVLGCGGVSRPSVGGGCWAVVGLDIKSLFNLVSLLLWKKIYKDRLRSWMTCLIKVPKSLLMREEICNLRAVSSLFVEESWWLRSRR